MLHKKATNHVNQTNVANHFASLALKQAVLGANMGLVGPGAIRRLEASYAGPLQFWAGGGAKP